MARLPTAAAVLLGVLLAAASVPAARAQWTPDNFIASGDACRSAGRHAGAGAARDACASARASCRGGPLMTSSGPSRGIGPVSLPQCANIAYGSCQQAADWRKAPCAGELRNGAGRCSPSEFGSYYDAAMASSCYAAAAGISDVAPGTRSWAGPYGPSVPVVVSPGSVVGGAIGSAIGGSVAGRGIGSAVGGVVGTAVGNAADRVAIRTVADLVGRRRA
jgi:hypothetical protein